MDEDDFKLIEVAFEHLISEAARIEYEHGFGAQTPVEDIALMHSELSEALEELRDGLEPNASYTDAKGKPCGVPSELADVVIRIMGFCYRHNVGLARAIVTKMDYNETRTYKHGRVL